MRAAVYKGPHSIEVAERPDPVIAASTDAVVRVVLGCVCGSDLWYYRGESPHAEGSIGHEFIGVVEDVGTEVRSVAKGDFVIAPFKYCDGTCVHCRAGLSSQCVAGGAFGDGKIDGGQGEAVRVPLAGGTLVRVPGSGHSDETLRSLLALSDVMCTGHHAAVSAGVRSGSVVGVVGDGAVGLCGIIAALRLGATRIIALSRNPSRQELARSFGATDIIAERGEAAIAAIQELTNGVGVDAALECVGTGQSVATALAVRSGDDIYLRSVRGRSGHWFRGAQDRHEGRIRASGVQQDVTFVDAGHDIDNEVDGAYRAKYRRYAGSILNSVLTPEARSATFKIVPR